MIRRNGAPLDPAPAVEGTPAPLHVSPTTPDEAPLRVTRRSDTPTPPPVEPGQVPSATGIEARAARRAPGDDEPEMSWGDTMSGAAKNLIPSSKRALVETGRALTTELPQTWEGIKGVGTGLASKAQGALGMHQDEAEKAHDERVVDALGKYYGDTYGSMKGFKKAVATDPASVMMDASTPISGGLGLGAKAAGATSKIGKALALASKAASYADPVSATLGAAGAAARIPNSLAKTALSKTSSVPKTVLDLAESAGRSADPSVREAFIRHYSGQGDARELLNAAQSAIGEAQRQRVIDYNATKAGQAAAAKTANYAPIVSYVDNLPKSVNPTFNAAFQKMPNGTFQMTGVPRNNFTDMNKLAVELRELVDGYAANPAAQSYHGLDALKQAVYAAAEKHGLQNNRHVMGLYNNIKGELENAAPGYQKMMEDWQDAGREINDLTKGLAAGQNVDASRALTRMMRSQNSEHGQDLLRTMAQYDRRIPYMVAGQTLRQKGHGGLRGVLEWAVPLGSAATLMHPGPLGYIAASSPKVVGGGEYAFGAANRLAGSPTARAGRYAAYETRPADAEETPKPVMEGAGNKNNNPGNVEATAWTKKQPGYKGSDGRFAIFETPEHGMAATRNLIAYKFDQGNNTIEKLVNSWLGTGSENSPAAREGKMRVFEQKLGINRNQRLQKTPDVLNTLASAMDISENGYPRRTRAAGGRIIDHVSEANKLISAAHRGLTDHNSGTEHLLDMHDDAVAHALKTADEHI